MPSRIIALAIDLHVRPAREVAEAVASFDAAVLVGHDDADGRASSPLELTALGAEAGDEVTITADGQDAQDALDAVAGVLADQSMAAHARRDAGGQDR